MKIIVILLVFAGWYGAKRFYAWLTIRQALDKIDETIFPHSAYCVWTVCNWCDASKAYRDWIENNPLESFSHPEAQGLLRIEIGAYMLFLDAHPYCQSEEHTNSLRNMVAELDDWVI